MNDAFLSVFLVNNVQKLFLNSKVLNNILLSIYTNMGCAESSDNNNNQVQPKKSHQI